MSLQLFTLIFFRLKNSHISINFDEFEAFVPRTFWCKAAHNAVHLINSMPTHVLNNVSPFESLFGEPPSYSHFRVLDLSVLFIYHQMNAPSYLPNLHGVSSYGTV